MKGALVGRLAGLLAGWKRAMNGRVEIFRVVWIDEEITIKLVLIFIKTNRAN